MYVKYIVGVTEHSSTGANVHATTATGDTALTYACENGHTDVADVLLQAGADLVRSIKLLKYFRCNC